MSDGGTVAVSHPCELTSEHVTQRGRRFDRHDFASTLEQLERQPPGARTYLDDSIDPIWQPPQHSGMESLRAGETVIEPGLQPVEKFPGERDIYARVGPATDEPTRLVRREHPKIRDRIASAQFARGSC